jgi:hypothetical protein
MLHYSFDIKPDFGTPLALNSEPVKHAGFNQLLKIGLTNKKGE